MRRLLVFSSLLTTLPFSLPALASPTRAETIFSFDTTPGELPKTVVPSAYVIDLVTDPAHLTLSGRETVTIEVRAATSSITLNQAGLTLSAATLDSARTATVTEDQAAQTVTLHFPAPVAPGRHVLTLAWSGPILTTPNGIYRDDYRDAAGKTRQMLVTQFEVADARRMFPCWDEPAFKATFQLNVTMPFEMTPLSNMPVLGVSHQGAATKRVSFRPTPRMSTYLLALVAGDLERVSGETDGVSVSVYAPAGREDQGRHALSAALALLPYYDDYFAVHYPLPKLDMVAIPGNYEAGAMENWGLLTFIDNDLLYDPATSSAATKELVYEVVAHEMAHQWSGDLVTMGWWDNLWLNEGFASWMECKATDRMNPAWQIWPRQHATREKTMAMDGLASTHPIQQPVKGPSDADAAFDDISYGKGELVIRMIEDWLGEDHFRDGMRRYMAAHAYGSTTSADLWQALSAVSAQDVGAVARSFTTQPGIPLVRVASSCANGRTVYHLDPSRFTLDGRDAESPGWRIPVVAGGPGLGTSRLVLGGHATLEASGCAAPLKLNLGESGYYRVAYDDAAFTALNRALTRFAPADRANLLGDQFALFEAGQAPLARSVALLNTLEAAGGERNIAVVEELIAELTSLDHDAAGSPHRPAFEAWARRSLAPVFKQLGWTPRPGETLVDTILRPEVIDALGRLGDAAVIDGARRRFAAWRADPSALRPDQVGPVAGMAVRTGLPGAWETVAARVKASTSTEEKARLLDALSQARDPASIRRNVAFAYGGGVPNGRIVSFLGDVAESSEQPDLVWSLVKAQEATIRPHLTPGSTDKLLPRIAAASIDPATLAALATDPAATRSPGARIATQRALETARTHQAVVTRVLKELASF
ncbi:M1 family metallopeptidase [Acidomonas methanolica]|uniref:M1 family metallopeptidase n=1 Tax=Acidomonas methanolica TaxID=437 RepID=UPI001C045808|nr:M1 family metallopeptidase [Acidomonas methanolica]MBU2652817.1 M1 family metallopeptidase [Acidomonas methanolica]